MALSLDPDRSNDIHLELDDEYDQGLDNFGNFGELAAHEKESEAGSSQARSATANTGNWEIMHQFKDKDDLSDFFYTYPYKLTATHGNQKSRCPIHTEKHSQAYGYYSCLSVKCHGEDDEKCSFRIRVSSM